MANTVTIDANRQELWSKELMDDVITDLEGVMQFAGEDANNVLQISRELGKKKGDTENFSLVARLTGDGVVGGEELEGNEESMDSFNETVSIDQLRNAVRLDGKLDAQKVVYDQIKKAREVCREWMKEQLVKQFFLKAGGVTNTSLVDTNGVAYSGRALWSNTPAFIPDADEAAGIGARYICADAAGTDSLEDTDIMTLDLVEKAATLARLTNPLVQPLNIDGGQFYVMYLHPLQARDIRLSDDWKHAQQYARARGEKNPIFGRALGVWSDVILMESRYVPWLDISVAGNSFRGTATGTDCTADCARALLCGRQAVIMAEASNPKALVVETFDYQDKDGIATGFIGGFQKTLFNSKEFGVIAVDSAAKV